MPLNSVYMVKDDDKEAPPSHVMKVALFDGGYVSGTGEHMPPVIYFCIGDFEEGTYEDSFRSSADRQFSVTLLDLIRALIGLGAVSRVEIPKEVEFEDATQNNCKN